MQKRFLVTALIFVLGFVAVWLYLAEQFEKMIENDVKVVFEETSPIIRTDIQEIKVDKYKFKIHLGHFDFLPDNEDFSYSFERAEISYNPFKDKFTITPGGDKIISKNRYDSYYIQDPKMSISFDGVLFSKNLLDGNYSLEIKQKDIKLHSQNSGELILEQDFSSMVLSHKKNGDMHLFKFETDGENSTIHKSSSALQEIFASIITDASALEGFADNVLALINEIFSGKSMVSLEVSIPDTSLAFIKEDSENSSALENQVFNPMRLLAISAGDFGVNFGFKSKIGTKNPGKFVVNFDKNGDNFSIDIQNDIYLDEKFNNIYASIIPIIYSNEGFVVSKDDILAFLNKYHLGSNSSSIAFNISAEDYAHNLKIDCNGKVFELKGKKIGPDDSGLIIAEEVKFDNILAFIDYSKSYIHDLISIIHANYIDDLISIIHAKANTPSTAELNNALDNASKSLEIFAPALKDLATLLHKGNALKLGDTFKSDFKVDLMGTSSTLVTEINGRAAEEVFSTPEFVRIMQNFAQASQNLGIKYIHSTEPGIDFEESSDVQD